VDSDLAAALKSVDAVYDHVAHALPSIAAALPLYRDLLGGRPVSGGVSDHSGHLAVHFEFGDGRRVELLEPIRPDSQSLARFLRRNPRGGLHHITFKVPDIEHVISVVKQLGYEVVGTKIDFPEWRETFLHPRSTGGALIQFAQSAPDIPRPLSQILSERGPGARSFRGNGDEPRMTRVG
jgi:methylmalonyl-CoA/ethylmalonyl-CoA epimerase